MEVFERRPDSVRKYRKWYLEQLAEHYAECRIRNKEIELENMDHIKRVKRDAVKYKWYLPERQYDREFVGP